MNQMAYEVRWSSDDDDNYLLIFQLIQEVNTKRILDKLLPKNVVCLLT